MRLLPAIRKLEALAAERNAVVAEYNHRAANAAFDAAIRQIPDGDRMARALARRLLGHSCGTLWEPTEISKLSEQELRERLAGPLRVLRGFRRSGAAGRGQYAAKA